MEVFILLLIFGYYMFFKGVVSPKRKTASGLGQNTVHEAGIEAEPVDFEGAALPLEKSWLSPSQEGHDPCHDDLYHRPERIQVQEEEKPFWKPDLSAQSLWQAVVMQEVLTRPCQRPGRFGSRKC